MRAALPRGRVPLASRPRDRLVTADPSGLLDDRNCSWRLRPQQAPPSPRRRSGPRHHSSGSQPDDSRGARSLVLVLLFAFRSACSPPKAWNSARNVLHTVPDSSSTSCLRGVEYLARSRILDVAIRRRAGGAHGLYSEDDVAPRLPNRTSEGWWGGAPGEGTYQGPPSSRTASVKLWPRTDRVDASFEPQLDAELL